MRQRQQRGDERGTALLLSLGVVVLLGTLGSSLLMRSLHEHQLGSRSAVRQRAFFLAEAAVDHAINNLRANDPSPIPATALLTGTYWAEIAPLDGTRQRITAHGRSVNEQRTLEVVVQQTGQSIFQAPLFGDDGVKLKKGALTDSYDSRLGSYNPATAGQRGNVWTNETDEDSIVLRQGTAVNGQVIVGPGLANPSEAVSMDGSAVITGNPPVVSAPHRIRFPAVNTSGLSCGQDLTLPQDSTFVFEQSQSPYCFNEIRAAQGSTITVSGNVMVYANRVDFDKHLSVNANGKPTQLILQIASDDDVVIDKAGTFVGGIYAPKSEVRLKRAVGFYGAIVAEEVTIDKQGQFHFDEALIEADGPQGSSAITVLLWQEP